MLNILLTPDDVPASTMTYAASFDRGCESLYEEFDNACTDAGEGDATDEAAGRGPQLRPAESSRPS